MTRYDTMIDALKANAVQADDILLLALFEKYPHVKEHYETCVPALDGTDFWQYTPSPQYPLNQFHGPVFHKGFRQFDVVDVQAVDQKIYQLLMWGCPAFWDAHELSMRTDAAKGEPK